MELLIFVNGRIEIDGAAAGAWEVDESTLKGRLTIVGEPLAFEITGPFGGGFCVSVTGGGRPALELQTTWRDGDLFYGDARESRLALDTTVLTRDDATVAGISWTSQYVRLQFSGDVPLLDAARYGVLIAMNRFFGDKSGPFRLRN